MIVKKEDYKGMFEDPIEAYGDGGLYPIHVNDLLQDKRYQILRKLGFGSYSTVWAARDHQYFLDPFLSGLADNILARISMYL
jgi:serine/threonine protein kinase